MKIFKIHGGSLAATTLIGRPFVIATNYAYMMARMFSPRINGDAVRALGRWQEAD